MTQYTVKYEIGVGSEIKSGEMVIDAVSEEHAVEHCGNLLDQDHNQGENENDVVLLECQVVGVRK